MNTKQFSLILGATYLIGGDEWLVLALDTCESEYGWYCWCEKELTFAKWYHTPTCGWKKTTWSKSYTREKYSNPVMVDKRMIDVWYRQ